MPSTYNQQVGGADPGVTVGDNTRKTLPTTKMGTRQIVRITVYTNADIETDFDKPNSLYSQLVRALQQQVELYAVYTPGTSFFDCNWEYAFAADIAWDTANALWNFDPGSVVTDNSPDDWEFSTEHNIPNDVAPLIVLITSALQAAEADDDCWVATNYAYADMCFPIDFGTGAAPPQANREIKGRQFMANPGDTLEQRKAKRAAWIASMKG